MFTLTILILCVICRLLDIEEGIDENILEIRHHNIDGFRDYDIYNDPPFYGEGYLWDLNYPNVNVILFPRRGVFEFVWKVLLEM